jgi:hypothetical protein
LPTGRNFGRKTQKWPNKNLSGWKRQRPNILQIFQKMAEEWQNFPEDYIHIKKLRISAEKYTLSPYIFHFPFPLPREIVCKKQ